MGTDGSRVSLAAWYISTFERSLRIKDKEDKDQIIGQIKPSIINVSKKASSKEEMVSELGDPRILARELSDPRNWVLDIGSPLSPRREVKPFFSNRGRLFLMVLFLIGIVIPAGMFILRPELGWVLPGLLLSFVALWALGISFLNNFLGYLGTAQDLKETGMKIGTMGRKSLRNYIFSFVTISVVISIILGSGSVILDTGVLSVSFPITLSTIAATIMAARMMYMEGKKVLEP